MKKLLLGIGVGIGVVTALTFTPVINFEAVDVTNAASGEPAKTEPLERIPFTNKDVTPGDPESYIGTYGQCPFYENAGPKGCFPPPDITCNADWSKCEPTKNKAEGKKENAPTNDTRSTESKKEQSKSSTCSN